MMSGLPAVSVIIPLYNKENYIAGTLKSVLAQIFQDFEVIIVDDGSTDGGVELVRQIDDPRIRLIVQENSGVSVARNHGASKAVGEFLIFLDADDQWYECFLDVMVGGFVSKDIKWVMCGEDRVVEGRAQLLPYRCAATRPRYEKRNFFELFLKGQTGCPGTILMRREMYNESRGFIRGIKNGEDVEMWLRLALRYPEVNYCSEHLVSYMVDSPCGATVLKRSEDSLIMFWKAMGELFRESEMSSNCEMFKKCFNMFANKSYRFYVRSNYHAAAAYLLDMNEYVPSRFNRLLDKLPQWMTRLLLYSVNQARFRRAVI